MAESYAEINFSTFTSVSAASNPVPVMVTSWPPFSDPVEGEILLTSDKVWNTYLKKKTMKKRDIMLLRDLEILNFQIVFI